MAYLNATLIQLVKKASKRKSLSPEAYLSYLKHLQIQSDRETLKEILEEALEFYPKYAAFWQVKIQTSPNDNKRQSFDLAAANCPNDAAIWLAYYDYLSSTSEDQSSQETEHAVEELLHRSKSIPLSATTSSKTESLSIMEQILIRYLDSGGPFNYKAIQREYMPSIFFWRAAASQESDPIRKEAIYSILTSFTAARPADHLDRLGNLVRGVQDMQCAQQVFWSARSSLQDDSAKRSLDYRWQTLLAPESE